MFNIDISIIKNEKNIKYLYLNDFMLKIIFRAEDMIKNHFHDKAN
jgi:hypothetical protein